MNETNNLHRRRVLILGAGGRDFHNFNVAYRDAPHYEVVAFTATQIPDIDSRSYPPQLSGPFYPKGIPVLPMEGWEALIERHAVDDVILAYSDLSHEDVMHIASRALAAGASFRLLGPKDTMLPAVKPVISICAVRTGCGKSPVARFVAGLLRRNGLRVAVVRHPMPYGDLARQAVQRFVSLEDMTAAGCTIEEREEYEPHIASGDIVFAGVDYERILRAAEAEADVIIWDGGNNDLPFFQPDLEIVLADPHRPGHETTYHPGEANLLRAGAIILTKVDTADPHSVRDVRRNVQRVNPDAVVIETAMPLTLDNADAIRGKRVLVIEDGPTVTHGGMGYGAGLLAARRFGAAEVIDPRPFAKGSLQAVFEEYRHLERVLPAMGYSDEQVQDLAATIDSADCDAVLIASPVDLRRLLDIRKPAVRVGYELQELEAPLLSSLIERFIETHCR